MSSVRVLARTVAAWRAGTPGRRCRPAHRGTQIGALRPTEDGTRAVHVLAASDRVIAPVAATTYGMDTPRSWLARRP